MSRKEIDFVVKGRSEMGEYVRKAIDDLLEILDSRIIPPTTKEGLVLEHKLLAVVQSREAVYNSTCELMDLIKLSESNDKGDKIYKEKIIRGLKTTWHELTAITTRNIGDVSALTELIGGENLSAEQKKKLARESVTDDYMTNISKAKVLSATVSFKILDRISLLEDPESANDEAIKNSQGSNIAEQYAEG